MSELGIKERSDKDKYASTLDSLINENVFVMKYLYENFSMEEVEKYCKWDVDLSVERRIGPLKNALIQMLQKLAKKQLLNMFIKTLIDEGQFLIPLKCYESIEITDTSGKIVINKCPAKKNFNKAVKKLDCKDYPWASEGLGYCKYWCSPLFQKFLSYIKVPLEMEYTNKGCIITARFKE
ncbi:MAG: hypothetical protein ACTSYB_12620 [Candidatus Helarchaeota archaeon]